VLIILEGVDGAGKSTVAGQLADAIRASRPGERVVQVHKSPPTHHPLVEYEQPLFHYRPGGTTHMVCDRWHVGEAVYPDVLERPTAWDEAVRRHVDMLLASRGALIVYVDPPSSRLRRQFEGRGEDPLVDVEQLVALRAGYDGYFSTVIGVVWDRVITTVSPLVIEQIITKARVVEARAQVLNPFVTYVGSPTPSWLLVGDVRNELKAATAIQRRAGRSLDPASTINNGPAFGPFPGTSGHFLLKHLPDTMVAGGVGLANACDVDDIFALRRSLGNPPTLALGVNAYRVLAKSPNRFGPGTLGAAPHPQYVRRFLHRHGPAYGELVYRAVTYAKNELSWRAK